MSQFDAFTDFRMHGHSAIVTGGAQNIGEAIARSFSGAGAKVMIADLNGDKAKATAEKIANDTGNEVLGMACYVNKVSRSTPVSQRRPRASAASQRS